MSATEKNTLDNSIRLRIATRIHFALLRHFDENVEVDTLLRGSAEAREALWVCEASDDAELTELARQYRRASRVVRPPPAPMQPIATSKPAPQDVAWTSNTSGFGVSVPFELEPSPDTCHSGWSRTAQWFKRAGQRMAR